MSVIESVLLCEDDGLARRLLAEHLASKYGVKALEASTGQDALRMAELHNPQLLILDIMLRDSIYDGFDVCCRVKFNPLLKTRVIMLSGRLDPVDLERARECGADGYLVKPASPKQLDAAIEQILLGAPQLPQLFGLLSVPFQSKSEREPIHR
jgi:DNA-binding response OmpR family regulator